MKRKSNHLRKTVLRRIYRHLLRIKQTRIDKKQAILRRNIQFLLKNEQQ